MSQMRSAQKTPLSKTLNEFATAKAQDAIDQMGQAIPGHVIAIDGPIVTISFDLVDTDSGQPISLPTVEMPVFGAEYIRLPIQIGDKGVSFPADYYLGGVSGLGGGVANDTLRSNLSCLVWFPIGSNKFFQTPDANALVAYGPNGVILRDSGGNTSSTLTPTGITDVVDGTYNITAQNLNVTTTGGVQSYSADTIEISATTILTLSVGAHSIVLSSTGLVIDGQLYLAHEHTGVQTGGGVTGPVA